MPTQQIATFAGRNMSSAFDYLVATCWVLLAQVWKWSNLSQQHPTCGNRVAKRTQHVAPNNVAICCVRARWHVAIVLPGLKHSGIPALATWARRRQLGFLFKRQGRNTNFNLTAKTVNTINFPSLFVLSLQSKWLSMCMVTSFDYENQKPLLFPSWLWCQTSPSLATSYIYLNFS